MDQEVIEKSFDLPLVTKAFDVEQGIIKAYVTTFGNEDYVGDIIAKGAVDEFVKNFDGMLPMLYEHNRDELIGEWTKFEIDDYGVLGTGELYDGVSRADDVRVYLSKGAVSSVSIGFYSSNYETKDDGGRIFKEITLVETSVVRTPANPQAQIVSAKNEDGSINPRAFEQSLREVGFSNRQSKALVRYAKEVILREVEQDALSKAKAETFGELLNLIKGDRNV